MTTRTQGQIKRAAQKFADGGNLLASEAVPLLIEELDYDHARHFLRSDVTMLEWDEARGDTGAREARRVEVFEHACMKAHDHRGLSADIGHQRAKLIAWLHSDDLYQRANAAPYKNYGAPTLAVVADELGGEYLKAFEEYNSDGRISRMAQGQRCEPDCMEGCS